MKTTTIGGILAFDALQGGAEPPVSRKAQIIGFEIGEKLLRKDQSFYKKLFQMKMTPSAIPVN